MKKKSVLFFVYLLFTTAVIASECLFQKPAPNRFVNNFSKEFPNFLSSNELEALESKLVRFSNETSNQIVIVITDDLCGYDANSFATKLGQNWKVGQEKLNNGVVIVIKPSGGIGQRDAYIAVGRGLESAIPDITASHITQNEIITAFKSGDYYQGLDRATDILIGLAKGEFNQQNYGEKKYFYQKEKSFIRKWKWIIVIVLILFFWILFTGKNTEITISRRGRTYYGKRGDNLGNGWEGGRKHSKDFGGFGGGSFGGGGAGGKW